MSTATPAEIPSHVPPNLVRDDYPFAFGATSKEDPFKVLAPRVHEGPDIIYSTNVYPGFRPGWVPRRLEDLRAIYLDTEHFSNKGFSPFAALIGESWSQLPAEMDPPMHATYRALLNPLFAPKRLNALEGKVREAARFFIDKFKDRGECDFKEEFSFRFPIVVFLDLVDLPRDRMEEFLKWEHMLFHNKNIQDVITATKNVTGYLRDVVKERRKNPGDDFISFAVTAKIDGRPLTDDELLGFCFNLYVGGLDTVSTHITWQFKHLADNPADQARLRNDKAFIPTALEELYRAYSAVTTFRTCTKDVTVNGVTMKPGDKVAMATTLGNTDPAAWEEPSKVDLDRAPAHLTFAYGIHRCIGSHLARRESIVAMEEFLSAIPEFRVKPGSEIEYDLFGIVQPKQLSFVWRK